MQYVLVMELGLAIRDWMLGGENAVAANRAVRRGRILMAGADGRV